MTIWLCKACGVEHADSARPPERDCPICVDERQYVPRTGQAWISLDELSAQAHTLEHREYGPRLHGLHREPEIAIGQWTFLVQTAAGNLLWDPPNYLDEDAVELVRSLGGATLIAASHPHMFGVQVSWSRVLGGIPILVNAADREWIQRPDPAIEFWKDTVQPLPGVTLIQLGGHFPGSAVAHFAEESALLTGDTIGGTPDYGWVTFQRSYPNKVPLSSAVVRRIAGRLEPYGFERLYTLSGATIDDAADQCVQRSARRYVSWVSGEFDHLT